MLELRLRTLDRVVDTFVAVEAHVTHQGEPREPTLDPLSERWRPWAGRLRLHYLHEGAPAIAGRGGAGTRDYQRIEHWHREGIRYAVATIAEVDGATLVLVSDVDEIPAPHAIADRNALADRLRSPDPWLVFEQRFHSTALNLLHPQQPWLGTMIARFSELEPQAMRDARERLHGAGKIVQRGGWHFSWFGSDAERQQKLDTFSHAELRGRFDPAEARRRHEHANGEPLRRIDVSEMARMDWPEPYLDGTFETPYSWWVI